MYNSTRMPAKWLWTAWWIWALTICALSIYRLLRPAFHF
jgi:hypothetical protein